MRTPSIPAQSWASAIAVVLGSIAILGPAAPAAAAEPCARGEVCGLKNAEDLIRLEDSRWAIASRLGKDPATPGGFSLIDLQAQTASVLMPDVSGPADPVYSDCPGAPEPAELVTHGLDIRHHGGSLGELFAVNHGSRQSIEIFTVHANDRGVTLAWKGCVVLPADASANAVAALPDSIVVSSFGTPGEQGTAELIAGKPAGFVTRWKPREGWVHVPESAFGGDNGVAAAPDGSVLYVNDWSDGTLRVLPLRAGIAAATIKLGDFHPDNVHMLPDGNLLIAGQTGEPRDILSCVTESTCSVGSTIVVLDPTARRVRRTWSVAPTSAFGAASTALMYGEDYWVSSFRGDRIVRVGPAPGG